ncbi:Charged multivesicular body protein 7 [Heterocephalus glaber]|uniref:Charged multivesicular body protein 7 n=1 Tax=Heterocephalus glaber TaxID=10181 RepID=G5BLV0_HETGA|nr:Charged multivesicular body protein 7 [Heterocephalus glaber]
MWSPEREAEAWPAGEGPGGRLRSREVNSTDWNSKAAFWGPLVLSCSRRQGVVRLRLRDWEEAFAFQRKGRVPLGLATVLQDLLRPGELQRVRLHGQCGQQLDLRGALKWTLSKMLGDNKVPVEEVLVAVELLQEKAKEVYRPYQHLALSSHPVVALSELSTLCANSCPEERTFYLVLLQLQKEKRVTILEQNREKNVKFARGPCQGKKQLALRSLKAKQRTEKHIKALHAKLDTVQGILDHIYASQTDQMVFNAYQAGVGALKLSLQGVMVEKAESLVDQIQKLCDTKDKVSQSLAGGVTNGLDFDSEELEKELDILLQDTTKEPLDLPERPKHCTNSVPNPPMLNLKLNLRNCPYQSQIWSRAVNLQKGDWNQLSKAIVGPSSEGPSCKREISLMCVHSYLNEKCSELVGGEGRGSTWYVWMLPPTAGQAESLEGMLRKPAPSWCHGPAFSS